MASDYGQHSAGRNFFRTHGLLLRCHRHDLAIGYLGCVGATKTRFDFRSFLSRLINASRAEQLGYEDCAAHGSLLVGDLGMALMLMRLDPDPAIADLVYARANADTSLPVRELMWGTPGSMIASTHMAAMMAERRWRDLFAIQAARLLRETPSAATASSAPAYSETLLNRGASAYA